MSYNGSGTFLINTAGQPVVTGTVISSTTFNTLTADLGTGLSTAITKDGQTTTTSRIPFIAGISSTLTTDSTSVGTGSIITSGGVGIAKALFVGTTANIAGAVTLGGAVAITSASANALAVGLNGATNPAFNVDASTALSATGLNVKSAAAAGGVALSVSSSGSNEALTLNAKGTGTIGIGSVSTGAVTITPATTVTGLITSTGGITGGASSHTTGAFSSTLDVTGIASFAAGSAAAPAITRTGDLDTGVWFPAANALGLSSGGTNAVYINSSQNVGIGTSSPVTKLQLGGATDKTIRIDSANSNAGFFGVYQNQNIFSVNRNPSTGTITDATKASAYITLNGNASDSNIVFATTATNNIEPPEKMRLDNAGSLLVGTTIAYGTSKLVLIPAANPTTASSSAIQLSIGEATANTGYSVKIGYINEATLGYAGSIQAIAGGNPTPLLINADGGPVLIGILSNPNAARVYARYDTLTTQPILNSATIVAASTSWSHFIGQSGNGSSVTTNNIFILGNGNVQNANNSYGAISDIKLKENIVDASPKLNKLMQVRIRNYNLKGDYEQHKQLGVVAQELEQVFPAMVSESPDVDAEGNDLGTTTKSVKYSVFVPMLIKAMQEQQALIQSLTTRLTALEAK